MASVRARITAGSIVLIFLITLDDNLSEKPWFVGVIRTGSMRSIASDYFLVAKSWSESKILLWEKFTIGIPIVNAPQYHKAMLFCSKMIDRAIDLHDACRITPTNHGFSAMSSPKVIRKIKIFDPATIVALTEAKEIFFCSFSTSD